MRYIICFSLLILVACGKVPSDKKVLTVTIEPYRFVVEAVAGDEWQVNSLLPKGSNPETADLSPRAMASLQNSKAFFLVGGLGFEREWVSRIAETYPSLQLVDTSFGIEREFSDPHLWTSPDNMMQIAHNVCNFLCEFDTVNSDGYKARLSKVQQLFSSVDSAIYARLADSKVKGFVIFHPSLTYFASRYGLKQLAVECDGKEPSATHIRSLIDEARCAGVKHVFLQQEFHKHQTEILAAELNAKIVNINPLSYEWQNEMLHIADCLNND